MRNRFVISESDRRSILSMYGLLNEEIKDYTFDGKVVNKEKEPVEYTKISIISDDVNFKKINTITDYDGKFTINAKLDDSKEYFIYIDSKDYNEYKEKLNLNKTKNLEIVLKTIDLDVSLQELIVSVQKFTNIKINVTDTNNQPLNDFNLIFSVDKKTILNNEFSKSDVELNILQNDLVIENMVTDQEYDYVLNNQYKFYSENKEDKQNIKITIKKDGFEDSVTNTEINLSNAYAKFPIIGTNENRKIKKPNNNEIIVSDKTKNTINIQLLKKVPEKIKFVIYGTDKLPMDSVYVEGLNSDYKGTTNQNGEIDFELKEESIGQILNFTFKKDGYKTQYKEIEIKKTNNVFKLKFLSKKENEFSLGDEPLDSYKDSMYYLYGRAETDISNKESIKLAKLDAINKYIEEHKKRYKELGILKDVDINIEYDLAYGRPIKTAKTKQKYFNIVKIKKKDIKNYLTQLLEKENIEPVQPPIEFDELTLPEAIEIAYQQGQDILILAGLDGEELTEQLKKKLDKSKISKEIGINEKYLPLFINNDRNNSNNKILRSIVPYGDYPRIIILKPKNNKEVSVVTNDLQI